MRPDALLRLWRYINHLLTNLSPPFCRPLLIAVRPFRPLAIYATGSVLQCYYA